VLVEGEGPGVGQLEEGQLQAGQASLGVGGCSKPRLYPEPHSKKEPQLKLLERNEGWLLPASLTQQVGSAVRLAHGLNSLVLARLLLACRSWLLSTSATSLR
jgi:hypothetical protein